MNQPRLFPYHIGAPIQFENGRIVGPLDEAPIIVSLGVGVDSVAMLVEMQRRGIRPDTIITALVGQGEYGNEHPRFYLYLPVLNSWLKRVGFPEITFVHYELGRKAKHFHYESLAGNCISNRTLPSIAFRRNHSCSLKWKGDQIDKYVTAAYCDQPCYRLVGYDCTEIKRVSRFSTKTNGNGPRSGDMFIYPLQLWGMNRDDCERSITQAGLPSPGKSSCVFCPSMKPEEIDDLDPVSLWLIVIMEANASPNLKTIKGLWGHDGRMTDYVLMRNLLPAEIVREIWDKWAADERPYELAENPEAIADEVLFNEARRLAEYTRGK